MKLFGPTKHCTECGAALPARAWTGRPRLTCSNGCALQRNARLKRELEAELRAPALVGPGLEEFEAWRKGATP